VNRAVIDGITLEYEDSGTGEPVICIHGAFIADTFRPLQFERSIANRYRLISYHRRGYVGSGPIAGTGSLADEVHDCCALLSHLGVRLAHVIGHSFGGVVALQLALEVPQLVHTVTLLEAALMVGDSEPLYRQGLQQSVQRYREAGARVVADEFLQMRWPGYREPLEKALPGAFEQAVADAPASFAGDVPAALHSRFGEKQAIKITQPASSCSASEASPFIHVSPRPTNCCSTGSRTRKASSYLAQRTSCTLRTRGTWPALSPTSMRDTRSTRPQPEALPRGPNLRHATGGRKCQCPCGEWF
jgi:pimeloyl-ACP methyl ester carboxylesterase